MSVFFKFTKIYSAYLSKHLFTLLQLWMDRLLFQYFFALLVTSPNPNTLFVTSFDEWFDLRCAAWTSMQIHSFLRSWQEQRTVTYSNATKILLSRPKKREQKYQLWGECKDIIYEFLENATSYNTLFWLEDKKLQGRKQHYRLTNWNLASHDHVYDKK